MQSIMRFFHRRPARLAALWCLGGLLFIIMGTLAPYNFTALSIGKKDALKTFFQHSSDWFDFYGNIVLFFPYGYGLGKLLKSRKLPLWSQMGLLVLFSFSATLMVEVLQLFLPSRSSSVTDLFTNTLGGMLSGVYVLLGWQRQARKVMVAIGRGWSHTGVVTGLIVVWMLLMNAVPLKLQSMTDLSTWDASFPLVMGNDGLGRQPWNGNVSEMFLMPQALDASQIPSSFQSPQFPKLTAPVLLGKSWTQADFSPDAVNAIRQSNQFTLATTIELRDLKQAGPDDQDGRVTILTIALDQYQRNISLFQQFDRLVVTVRSPITGYSGDLFLLMNRQNLEPQTYRLLITYAEGRLRLYINPSANPSGDSSADLDTLIDRITLNELILKPEFTFFQYILPNRGQNLDLNAVNHRTLPSTLYPLTFYAIWSIPLGILVLRVFTLAFPIARRSRLTQLWLMVLTGLPTLLFALILTTSVSEFSPIKWGICWVFSLIPMVWQFWHLDRLSHRIFQGVLTGLNSLNPKS